MEIKVNDVYKFAYNEEWCKKKAEPYWCFDGTLIVKQGNDGNLYLVDTYWGMDGGSSNKTFTLEEALEKGSLHFYCNLDEVEECSEYDFNYYADEDLFDLSYQNRCYRRFYKRKGAKRSAEKMKKVLEEKIKEAIYKIKHNTNKLQDLSEKLGQVKQGNTDITI